QVEPLAARMGRRVWARSKARELLRQMGDVLLVQHKMIGRVEVTEKPEITWEDPELECLCDRLQEEYDLSERDEALERKLELLYRTSESIHDLLQEKRSLRVEWYIVVLIAIEILISVYEMWHGR
ncbi:MAG: RMD1 family protein, partial [Acidobacteriota bacterium]